MSTTEVPTSIAFVVANYPPHSGGVQQHVQAVARRLVNRGIPTTVYCCEKPGQRFDEGVRVRGMGRHAEISDVISFPSPHWWRSLSRELERTNTSHVSVHTRFFPATWLGVSASRRAGIPVILTEHGGGPVQTGSPIVQAASRAVDQTWGRRAIRTADAATAVSERAANFTYQLSGRRPIVIPNGIDLDFWQQKQDLTSKGRLLFVGRLVEEKGWRSFLDIVLASPQRFSALLVGEGSDFDLVRTAVQEKNLENRVTVTGALSLEELREVYPGSVYVNPSTASEGCQTTLLEAAACGASIATYDVGGAAEVAESGARITIVPSGKKQALQIATQELLLDDAFTTPIPDMSSFSWDQIVDNYLALFTNTYSTSRSAVHQ